MARASNTEERREQIVRGLLRVMARRGYAGATIPEIAREADLLPGLVHYHFASKQAILLSLVELLASGVKARFERLAVKASTPRERLYAFLDAHVAKGPGADPDAVACWVALGAEALADPEVRAAYRRVIDRELADLRQLVAAVLARDKRAPESAREIAAALLAAIEGAFRLAAIAEGAAREGYAASALHRMADGLILGAPRTYPEIQEGLGPFAKPMRERPAPKDPAKKRKRVEARRR